jgi:hypothetical protein
MLHGDIFTPLHDSWNEIFIFWDPKGVIGHGVETASGVILFWPAPKVFGIRREKGR